MWRSIRGRRRCVVVAEGFYEWLKKGNDRVPHHVKRKDGKLFCFAGLWDTVTCVWQSTIMQTAIDSDHSVATKARPSLCEHILSSLQIVINSLIS